MRTVTVKVCWGGTLWPRQTVFKVRLKSFDEESSINKLDGLVQTYFGGAENSRRYWYD
jgi:hypothetical protein